MARAPPRSCLALAAAALLLPAAPAAPGGGPEAAHYVPGTFHLEPVVEQDCPAWHACLRFRVECLEFESTTRGALALAPALGPPRGAVVVLAPGGGDAWFSDAGGTAPFLAALRGDGFHVVQVRWAQPWMAAPEGREIGIAHLACAPAAVFFWLHERLDPDVPELPQAPGRCGLCVVAEAEGASQAGYALSHYFLSWTLDGVVLASGPTHGHLVEGCLRAPGAGGPGYPPGVAAMLDASFGLALDGPCTRRDAAWRDRWHDEGIATGGLSYWHDVTRVHLLVGAEDATHGPAHARAWAARLDLDRSPMVAVEEVAGLGAELRVPAGLAAARAALLAEA